MLEEEDGVEGEGEYAESEFAGVTEHVGEPIFCTVTRTVVTLLDRCIEKQLHEGECPACHVEQDILNRESHRRPPLCVQLDLRLTTQSNNVSTGFPTSLCFATGVRVRRGTYNVFDDGDEEFEGSEDVGDVEPGDDSYAFCAETDDGDGGEGC